jgi:hypothetical protein
MNNIANNEKQEGPEQHNLELDKTEVFDEIDMASNLAIGYAEQAWKNHQAKLNVKKVLNPDFDGIHCFECGVKLPTLRVEMGCDRCTECQTDEDERQAKLSRR